ETLPNIGEARTVIGWWPRLARLRTSLHAQSMLGVFDQGVVSATSFAMSLVIGRICGAHELGTFALAMSIVMLVTALHDALISIPFTILRPQIAPARQAVHAGNSIMQVGLLGGLALLVFLIVAGIARLGF